MIDVLSSAFAVDSDSLCFAETTLPIIHFYDCIDCEPGLQKSYIKTKEDEPIHFTLHNPQLNNLCFAAVDNCLLGASDQARCDFIVGNTSKLYFVEIKTSKTKQRSQAKSDAINQLESSIEHLKSKADLTATELIAVICLKAKETHPLRNATKANAVVKFKELHNALLMEGQQDTF